MFDTFCPKIKCKVFLLNIAAECDAVWSIFMIILRNGWDLVVVVTRSL